MGTDYLQETCTLDSLFTHQQLLPTRISSRNVEPDTPFIEFPVGHRKAGYFFYPFIISNLGAAPGDTGNRKDIAQCLLTGSTVPQIESLKHSQKLLLRFIVCLCVGVNMWV